MADVLAKTPSVPNATLKPDAFRFSAKTKSELGGECSQVPAELRKPAKAPEAKPYEIDTCFFEGLGEGGVASLKSPGEMVKSVTGFISNIITGEGTARQSAIKFGQTAIQIGSQGVLATVMSAVYQDPEGTKKRIEELGKIGGLIKSKITDFFCYKPQVQCKMLGVAVGRIAADTVLFGGILRAISLGAELSGTLLDKVAEAINFAKGAVGHVAKVVIGQGGVIVNNVINATKTFLGASPWVKEAGSGLEFKVFETGVYMRQGQEVYEVTGPAAASIRNDLALYNAQVAKEQKAFANNLLEGRVALGAPPSVPLLEASSKPEPFLLTKDMEILPKGPRRKVTYLTEDHIDSEAVSAQARSTLSEPADTTSIVNGRIKGVTSDYEDQGRFLIFRGKAVPRQGFKIHISADYRDAGKVAEAILPELQRLKVTHKTVGSLQIYRGMSPGQQGKLITVYATDAKEANQIRTVAEKILEDKKLNGYIPIQGEKQLGSRGIFVRYGQNISDSVEDVLIKCNAQNLAVGPTGETLIFEGQPIDVRLVDFRRDRKIREFLKDNGALEEDERGRFSPEWVADPFQMSQ